MVERPPLPEHPDLRALAEALEAIGAAGDILDHKWRVVFTSTEDALLWGMDPAVMRDHYGVSIAVRPHLHPHWKTDEDNAARWWQAVGPHMVRDVPPDDPDFEDIFGSLARRARQLQPAPRSLAYSFELRPGHLPQFRDTWQGTANILHVRLQDADGVFIGTLVLAVQPVPQTLTLRLSRGDIDMYQRMDRLREPGRRATAILFADLEASGELSRRLSSRAYFELIRSLTDLMDDAVVKYGGIVGKHAGDGGSALFLADDAGSESSAARSAIDAARAIRDGAAGLMDGVRVKAAVHWGTRLMVGQVSTRGRLEVTALGDEMNEAARIETAAQGGAVLASKAVIEQLEAADAAELQLDPDALVYRTVAELTSNEKAVRDAGSIAVVEV